MASNDEIFDVIIIGCGPAGIAAAIEFQTIRKIKFLILEARNRVGGRVVTDITTFGKDFPVDLGAQWIHHYRPENPLYKYSQLSKDKHLNYHFILRSLSTPFVDIDGTRISAEKIDKAEKIFDQLCNQIKDSVLSSDQSVYDVIKNKYVHDDNDDPQIKRLIDLFFGFIEQYEAINLDELSAKCFLTGDNGIPEWNLAMPNGFGTLIQEIVEQHQLPVQLNSIVTRIDASSSLLDSLMEIYTKDQRKFLCKNILITIPLGCLKKQTIEFLPKLPEWKQNAIDKMGVGINNKIFLQFPTVFWDTECTSMLCTSARFRFILFRADTRIIYIKLAARVALEIEQENEEKTIDEVMILLRSIFSDRHVPDPNGSIITKWNQDPFANGSYSTFTVGNDTQTLFDLARECHDRIYWAGEHTDYDGTIGCVDSAFESGQREAKRIIKKLKL